MTNDLWISAPAKYDYNTGRISSASASCDPRDGLRNNEWMKTVSASRPIAGSAPSGRSVSGRRTGCSMIRSGTPGQAR